jgi:HAD superfamily hydrolase (TIGR01549 family)
LSKAVIFDIDGTLVDSVDLHAKAWQEAFAHFNIHVEYDAIRSQIGKGGDQLMPVFLSEQQLKELGKQIEEYRGELFKRKYQPQVRPFPAVRELFERIRQDGQQIALASSAKSDEIKIYKKIAHIEDLVQAETSADDVEESKPHPDIFIAAFNKLKNVRREDVVAVGDTPYDTSAAVAAGLKIIGVLCGGFPEPDLRSAGCIAIYLDPADLLAHYSESPLANLAASS